jgi:hypothetical protein
VEFAKPKPQLRLKLKLKKTIFSRRNSQEKLSLLITFGLCYQIGTLRKKNLYLCVWKRSKKFFSFFLKTHIFSGCFSHPETIRREKYPPLNKSQNNHLTFNKLYRKNLPKNMINYIPSPLVSPETALKIS